MALIEKVFVNNPKRVGEFIGVNLNNVNNSEEALNLLSIDNDKVKLFLDKYKEQLKSTSKKDIINFYEETGIYLTHEIVVKGNSILNVYFDINGVFSEFDSDNKLPSVDGGERLINTYIKDDKGNFKFYGFTRTENKKIFCHHLHIVSYVDEIIEEENKIYIIDNNQKECIYEIDKEEKNSNLDNFRFELNNADDKKNKINIIKKYNSSYLKNIIESEIKQIFISYPFNKLYILLNDGTLYEEDKVYAKNVSTIYNIDSYDSIIIYNDNIIEYLTHTRIMTSNDFINFKQYKKVLYSNEYLIRLDENNNLDIMEYLFVDLLYDKILCSWYTDVLDVYEDEKSIFIVFKDDQKEVYNKKVNRYLMDF